MSKSIDGSPHQRIEDNLLVSPSPEDCNQKYDLAYRLLFDFLADVEEVAVIAAKKGDGIYGQLEDEIVHRDTFRQVARRFGPVCGIRPETKRLISFIDSLSGPSSIAILNIVAETWLENVFSWLAKSGIATELFEKIAKEEARHAIEARDLDIPSPKEIQPLVQEVEFLLANLMKSPWLLSPMAYLMGESNVCKMGLDNVRKHKEACNYLKVKPGYVMNDVKVACRAITYQGKRPSLVDMNKFEEAKQNIFDENSLMEATEMVIMPFTDSKIVEAWIVKAIGRILATLVPRAHVTIRDKKLWQPANTLIGIRRLYDIPGDLVTTVYIRRPERLTVKQISEITSRRLRRIRKRPYYTQNESLTLLEPILPPPRSAAIVSFVGGFGVRGAVGGPMTGLEGNAIGLYVGQPHYAPYIDPKNNQLIVKHQVQIGIKFDHRCGDGREIGQVAKGLREYFEWLDSKDFRSI